MKTHLVRQHGEAADPNAKRTVFNAKAQNGIDKQDGADALRKPHSALTDRTLGKKKKKEQ